MSGECKLQRLLPILSLYFVDLHAKLSHLNDKMKSFTEFLDAPAFCSFIAVLKSQYKCIQCTVYVKRKIVLTFQSFVIFFFNNKYSVQDCNCRDYCYVQCLYDAALIRNEMYLGKWDLQIQCDHNMEFEVRRFLELSSEIAESSSEFIIE